jgi:prepilin-type N-terminal cleavage/methylation domain-containing protein
MRETFTSGTVGGAPENRCFYPEIFTFAEVEAGVSIFHQLLSARLFWHWVCISKRSQELGLAIGVLMPKRINSFGFTLIELLIVIAIIGILASIAIPQFSSYRQKSYNSATQSDLRNVKTNLEAFYADYQVYP